MVYVSHREADVLPLYRSEVQFAGGGEMLLFGERGGGREAVAGDGMGFADVGGLLGEAQGFFFV